jgi:hypothetical protein
VGDRIALLDRHPPNAEAVSPLRLRTGGVAHLDQHRPQRLVAGPLVEPQTRDQILLVRCVAEPAHRAGAAGVRGEIAIEVGLDQRRDPLVGCRIVITDEGLHQLRATQIDHPTVWLLVHLGRSEPPVLAHRGERVLDERTCLRLQLGIIELPRERNEPV